MRRLFLAFLFLTSAVPGAMAKGAGTSSGLALLKNSGARSSALGGAFVAMNDDVTGLDFNPAVLATMLNGQASLQYERGFFDDTFSKAMVSKRLRPWHALGVSVSYFSAGKETLFDGVNPQRSANVETDLMGTLGYGFRRGDFSWGTGVRYLKTELAETVSDSALSTDIGVQYKWSQRLRFGASGPVYQSKIQFGQKDEKLPRIYRVGLGFDFSMPLATGARPIRILFDVPYDANESEATFAAGAETTFGPLALRLGTNSRSDVQQFTMGAGFAFRQANIDYSFGLANNSDFEAVHKINLSLRFADLKPKSASAVSFRIYKVKPGETLQSIAQRRYGSSGDWEKLYALNRHMYASPDEIRPGVQILIPD